MEFKKPKIGIVVGIRSEKKDAFHQIKIYSLKLGMAKKLIMPPKTY